ncbi:MAG: hypothetical protein QM754_21055 [Tepidisphaeraceae bacterium]
MAGINFVHQVAAALEAKKLFHIDLNDQEFGRYDQDFRFGMANPKHAFFLVKLLDDMKYDGPRHFDAHAFRQSNYEDVKEFAKGCMRTYMILREKARSLERRCRNPGSAQADQRRRAEPEQADQEVQPRQRQEAAGSPARPRRTRQGGLALRKAGPADDGNPLRRPINGVSIK